MFKYRFLYFDLLELDEFGSTDLHVKTSISLRFNTIFAWTVDGWSEGWAVYLKDRITNSLLLIKTHWLVSFSTTSIAGIGDN